MEEYTERKLKSCIESAALMRLETTFKVFSLILGFNLIADSIFNGLWSNLKYKITLLAFFPVFKLFYKAFKSNQTNKTYLSFILGELLNFLII